MLKTIRDIAGNSVVSVCGTASPENNRDKIHYVLSQNKEVMDSFKHRIFVLNKITGFSTTEFNDIIADIKQMYSCVVLVEHVNRGYQFGFIDSDLMSFNYVRNNIPAYDFYFKYNMDTILYNKFLDITIENTADVIYPPEISCLTPEFKSPELYKTYKDACMDFSTSKEGKFPGAWIMPWLYMLSNKIDILYPNKDALADMYYKWVTDVKGDFTQWHSQNKVLCSEEMLMESLINEKLKKYCFIRDQDFDYYCNFIIQYRIGDATIKNVHLSKFGICHFHHKNMEIIEI